jgi:hypothetical protein
MATWIELAISVRMKLSHTGVCAGAKFSNLAGLYYAALSSSQPLSPGQTTLVNEPSREPGPVRKGAN